jgi:hypothetical protein
MSRSSLMDAQRLTRDLEAAYLAMREKVGLERPDQGVASVSVT